MSDLDVLTTLAGNRGWTTLWYDRFPNGTNVGLRRGELTVSLCFHGAEELVGGHWRPAQQDSLQHCGLRWPPVNEMPRFIITNDPFAVKMILAATRIELPVDERMPR